MSNTNLTYEIKKTLAVLSKGAKGWQKELNLISWNGRPPKYDIREWSSDHTKMGKGVTLTEEELNVLVKALSQNNSFDEPSSDQSLILKWLEDVYQNSPIFFTELRNLVQFVANHEIPFTYFCQIIAEKSLENVEVRYQGDKDFNMLKMQIHNELHMLKMIYSDQYDELSIYLEDKNLDFYPIFCRAIIS